MVGVLANGKGRSALMFFFLSMLFSPVIGLFAALVVSPSSIKQKERGLKSGVLKKCISCAETVNADDTVCRFCGRPLPEIIEVDATIENGS